MAGHRRRLKAYAEALTYLPSSFQKKVTSECAVLAPHDNVVGAYVAIPQGKYLIYLAPELERIPRRRVVETCLHEMLHHMYGHLSIPGARKRKEREVGVAVRYYLNRGQSELFG
jgi:predicted metal-dependent peptidase